MYKDEIKKIEYYKQQIISEYLKIGKLLSKNELQKKLDDIDLKIAIFKQGYIDNGENLNVEKFLDQKNDIYLDLKILYELIYEFATERLVKTQAKIEYTINYLNEIAKKYKYKTALESIGIYGDSVYYRTNGFTQYYDKGNVIIDLGSLSIKSGSYIACMLGCSDTEFTGNETVIFNFDDKRVSDYSYNKDLLSIEGNYGIKNYDYELEETTNTSFQISLGDDFTPNNDNKYNVFGGKDKIKIYYPISNAIKYVDKIENIPFTSDEYCEISFYIYNANEIIFDINDKYDYKSFSSYTNKSPKRRQKIYIKAQAGFVLDFSTDGTLYSDKTVGYIENNNLYSQKGFGDGVTSFMIEEIAYGEPVTIDNAYVEIKNAQSTFYDINYISIKQTQVSELDSDDL